jgi:hypothetical protein
VPPGKGRMADIYQFNMPGPRHVQEPMNTVNTLRAEMLAINFHPIVLIVLDSCIAAYKILISKNIIFDFNAVEMPSRMPGANSFTDWESVRFWRRTVLDPTDSR